MRLRFLWGFGWSVMVETPMRFLSGNTRSKLVMNEKKEAALKIKGVQR